MKKDVLDTIGGKPITKEMIDELSSGFERDWTEAEALVVPTEYGRAIAALQSLNLTVDEIEALERRAKHEQQPFSFFIKSVLQEKLAG